MEIITALSLLVTVIAAVAALIVVPEVRRFLGLEKQPPQLPGDSDSNSTTNSNRSVGEEFTPKPIAYKFRKDIDLNSKPNNNIIYSANVLGAHRKDIEIFIGKPIEVTHVAIGQLEPIPGGGELRVYDYEPLSLSVTFDKTDIARGLRMEGLQIYQQEINNWFDILFRMGLSVRQEPDIRGPLSLGWNNYLGYHIKVANHKVGGVINIVRIYQLPQTK